MPAIRLDRIFNHRLIFTPIASYVGFFGMLLAGWALISGTVSLWYLIPLIIGTFFILMGVTVGMHRLFCHGSFKTSPFWHTVLAYLGTIAIYGSTVQWPAMHATHHKFSDTYKDPHYSGWRYIFWKKNNPTVFNRRVLTRLYRQPLHRFMHRYYLLVVGVTVSLLALINPWLLVFLYLAPLGWLHLVGSIHQVFAHNENGPQDAKWLEVFLFTGGEWLHGHHHASPKDIRFGPLDAGYHFIKAIRS